MNDSALQPLPVFGPRAQPSRDADPVWPPPRLCLPDWVGPVVPEVSANDAALEPLPPPPPPPAPHRPVWNKGRVIGQKAPFKMREVCSIRAWLDLKHRVRDRALLDIALDSKLRGGDVVKLRVADVSHGGTVGTRATVRQSKTQRPVTFEITAAARKSVGAWIEQAKLQPGDYLFPSGADKDTHLGTRQYCRIVKDWAQIIGEDPARFGMHSLPRTKVTILYKQTRNLRAAQLLLGHSKIENTVRYLGVELEEALELSQQVDF